MEIGTPAAADHLILQLFAPGMSDLHRAGLGGLACTLKAIERHCEKGLMPAAKFSTLFIGGLPPWEIDAQSVTLKFGKPELASNYLKQLFEFAFQIKDGLIYLPGQYGDVPPASAVLAAIQDGIQNTFLQHGPTCGSRSGAQTVTTEVDGKPIVYTHDVFTSYKHQGWFWLDRDEKSKEKNPTTGKKIKTGRRIENHQVLQAVDKDGSLSGEWHEIDNKLLPGGIVRHDRFKQSAIRQTDAGLICLHFSMIGCLALNVNKVTAVLLVPKVADLLDFVGIRESLTPTTLYECRIANAADAVLQAQVRVRARHSARFARVPDCYALTCKPTQWNAKQKPRVGATSVPAAQDNVLDRFERALAWLPPHLVAPPQGNRSRHERARTTQMARSGYYWVDSIVRPLVAENLALGRPWYSAFVALCRSKAQRKQLSYEKKGLRNMTADDSMFDLPHERTVVRAVHAALRALLGKISAIYRDRPDLMFKKFDDELEKWGRAFAGAMTVEQFRKLLTDFFRRAGHNPELQHNWEELLPMLRRNTWQQARDLALIGLCSYQRRDKPQIGTDSPETT